MINFFSSNLFIFSWQNLAFSQPEANHEHTKFLELLLFPVNACRVNESKLPVSEMFQYTVQKKLHKSWTNKMETIYLCNLHDSKGNIILQLRDTVVSLHLQLEEYGDTFS